MVRHLLALIVVATCVSMALWQVRRLEARRADNAELVAQAKLPEVPLEQLLSSPENAAYRRVVARGAYDVAQEVVLGSRSFKERPGNHLLTPLKLDSGKAVVVDRGWVPTEIGAPGDLKSLPPEGEVEVTGVLLPGEDKGLFGISDPPPGTVKLIPRIDIARLAQQLPYDIPPLYLRLESQSPAGGELPLPVPLPPPDEGPHLDYAVQWCFFALASIAIYLALIRKESRRNKRAESQVGVADG